MANRDPELFLDPTMTVVLVGNEERRYVVHKALLCKTLGYFKTAYNTPMKEATENVFRFEDLPAESFATLVKWLYTGKIYLDDGEEEHEEKVAEALPEVIDEIVQVKIGLGPHAGFRLRDDEEEEEEEEEEEGSVHSQDDWDDTPEEDTAEEHSNKMDEQIDYEYDSGSEMDDSDMPRYVRERPTQIETSDGLPDYAKQAAQTQVFGLRSSVLAEDFEAALIRKVFPDTEARHLDDYQLYVLIHVHEQEATYEPKKAQEEYAESIAHWKAQREEVLQRFQISEDEDLKNSVVNVYNALTDLYILADRFDTTELKDVIMNRVQAEFATRQTHLHLQPLPSFNTVSKAFEGLPQVSDLRRWMLYIFSRYWRPTGDSPDQVSMREDLPKDFIFELMLVTAERSFWTSGDEGMGSYKRVMNIDVDDDMLDASTPKVR